MKHPFDISPELAESLHSKKRVKGLTHGFYRYPAQMSPELASTIIENFSQPGEVIFDPFMGGGTTIVEALATGRQALGIDINSLAVFVTKVKTTPLSNLDVRLVKKWAQGLQFITDTTDKGYLENGEPIIKNLPSEAQLVFNTLLIEVDRLSSENQRDFVKCSLLRLGQWALDGKSTFPSIQQLQIKFFSILEEMFIGIKDFESAVNINKISEEILGHHRVLLLRSVIDAHKDERIKEYLNKPILVVTSPPYVNTHILYHRWQIRGRKETPAPYWIIGANDGQGASYYTLGGRSRIGQEYYFNAIIEAFSSIKQIIHPSAIIVQLVSFSDVDNHLPLYLNAMNKAGYIEALPNGASRVDFWRTVPNRKWYNRIDTARSQAMELLLFHRLVDN